MIQTDATYKSILAGQHYTITHLRILRANSTQYFTDDSILSCSTTQTAFSSYSPECGACVAGQISATLVNRVRCEKGDKITVSVSISDGARTSSEVPQGTFVIDSVTYTEKKLGEYTTTITGYDALGYIDANFPSSVGTPISDLSLVNYVASYMGVTIDPDTIADLHWNYAITNTSGYSYRELLGYVAGLYGGNFVISKQNTLRLLRIGAYRQDTYVLVDESGNRITIGGYGIEIR